MRRLSTRRSRLPPQVDLVSFSRRDEQVYASAPGSFGEWAIKRGQRCSETLGEYKVGRVIGAQPMAPPGRHHAGKATGSVIDHDGQLFDQIQKPARLGLADASPTLGCQQNVGDLERSDRRDRRLLVAKPVQQRIGRLGCLILEAPRHRDARIEDEHGSGPALLDHVSDRFRAAPDTDAGRSQRRDNRLWSSHARADRHQPCHSPSMLGDRHTCPPLHFV